MNYKALNKKLFELNEKFKLKYCSTKDKDIYDGFELTELKKVYNQLKISNYPIIHVAGTNGKGSVVTKLSDAFTRAKYKSGHFTSPHLSTFRERIQINGKNIPKEAVERYLPTIFEVCEKLSYCPSFFEVNTLLALYYFSKEKVDIAVIEVGLGGRIDSTNIIEPILSVITSISLDHQNFLGDTLEKIAFEKGGIIKENIPVVFGPNAKESILYKTAKDLKAPVIDLRENFETYNLENTATAQAALDVLKDKFDLKGVVASVDIKPPCRMEKVNAFNQTFILDMAHNPAGLKRGFDEVLKAYTKDKICLIFSCSTGHDYKWALTYVSQKVSKVLLAPFNHPRLISNQSLYAYAQKDGLKNVELLEGLVIEKEIQKYSKDTLFLCIGSLYMMGEIRAQLQIQDTYDDYLIDVGLLAPKINTSSLAK